MAFEKVLLDFLKVQKDNPYANQVHNQGIEIHQKICRRRHFKVLEATWFSR